MHHPQIVIFERDGRLVAALAALAETERWTLRGSRQVDSCLRLLRQPGPGVLVVKVAKPAERDLALVEQVTWQLPGVPVVVVGEVDDAAVVAGLAWDVGAGYALFPPLSRDLLPGVVAGLMRAAIARSLPTVGPTS
jgi:FixJ family two-component response regulator